jgi:hypothetical protein
MSENITKRIVLSNEQIEESVQHFLPHYCEGTRDKFAFGFNGFAYKEGITEESVSKILENICIRTNDMEKNSRLETLHRTYINGEENGLDGIQEQLLLGQNRITAIPATCRRCSHAKMNRILYLLRYSQEKYRCHVLKSR